MSKGKSIIAVLGSVYFCLVFNCPLSAESPKKSLPPREIIEIGEVKKKLLQHKKKIDQDGAMGFELLFENADLRAVGELLNVELLGAQLINVDMSGLKLSGVNLSNSELIDVMFTKSHIGDSRFNQTTFIGVNMDEVESDYKDESIKMPKRYSNSPIKQAKAEFVEAMIFDSSFRRANLPDLNFSGAQILDSDFSNVNFYGAKLNNMTMSNVNFKGADLSKCNLDSTIFELTPGKLPDIIKFASATGLSTLKYKLTPHTLFELRKAFKEAGLRRQEREIGYAIHHARILNSLKNDTIFSKIDASTQWLLFDLTCKWGLVPLRPLSILFVLIILFSLPYLIAVQHKNKEDGIWKRWDPDRIRDKIGIKNPELLKHCGIKAVKTALYFSLLSAFHIGWKELNVGNWIARVHPKEYTLRATGWVRTVSGIQSLISVYLLALSVLTYFGRPFDQF